MDDGSVTVSVLSVLLGDNICEAFGASAYCDRDGGSTGLIEEPEGALIAAETTEPTDLQTMTARLPALLDGLLSL